MKPGVWEKVLELEEKTGDGRLEGQGHWLTHTHPGPLGVPTRG